jgi:ABC-2 type transport system permease protein
MLFPGQLRAKSGGGEFIPLLQSGDDGGVESWNDLVQQTPFGMSRINPDPRRRLTGVGYVLAARIAGKPSAAPRPSDPANKDNKPAGAAALNTIVVADLDLISETFFQLRGQKDMGLEFDNITFILNCVDVLAGDTSYVELRKRRLKHRTLALLEDQTKVYVDALQKETKTAEEDATKNLEEARKRLEAKIDALRKETETDVQTKAVQLERAQEVENRRLEVERINIEDAKRRKIADSKAKMETEVRKIQTSVRAAAVLLPPLPALALGAIVLAVRLGRENRGANPNRLA